MKPCLFRLGMFIDTSVIQAVFVPILVPAVTAFGMDLIHFGLIVIFNKNAGTLRRIILTFK